MSINNFFDFQVNDKFMSSPPVLSVDPEIDLLFPSSELSQNIPLEMSQQSSSIYLLTSSDEQSSSVADSDASSWLP